MALPIHSTTDHNLLRRVLGAQGLEFLGVADVRLALDSPARKEAEEAYGRWLAQGRHGTMSFLERHAAAKYDPASLLEGTQSIVVVGLGYAQTRPEPRPGSGWVARYAWGRDYHKVFRRKLEEAVQQLQVEWPGERWRCFADTAPLDERWWALQAGASFTARNSLAIRKGLGSWFLLGEILTSRRLTATPPSDHEHGSCPSGCQRCRQVCPTGALGTDGTIDARRCISYLTIEHRGPIDDQWKPHLGAWVFGCDLCQEVCPFNLGVKTTAEPGFLAWKAGPDLDLAELLALDADSFTRRFGGSPVHRTGRDGLVRNACLAAANLGRSELLPQLNVLCSDPDPGVSDAAQWACSRLGGS